VRAMKRKVEDGGVEDRFDLLHFSRRRRPGQGENSGTDDRADSQSGNAPRPESPAQAMVRFFRGGDQRVDAARAEEPVETGAAPLQRLRDWPLTICFTFFLLRAACHARRALRFGAAFRRAARFSALRSSVDAAFFVFIVVKVRLSSVRRISPLTSSSRGAGILRSLLPRLLRLRGGQWFPDRIWGVLLLYLFVRDAWKRRCRRKFRRRGRRGEKARLGRTRGRRGRRRGRRTVQNRGGHSGMADGRTQRRTDAALLKNCATFSTELYVLPV